MKIFLAAYVSCILFFFLFAALFGGLLQNFYWLLLIGSVVPALMIAVLWRMSGEIDRLKERVESLEKSGDAGSDPAGK